MERRSAQLSLPIPPAWGGRRPGAGRKPTPGRRPGVPHCRRPGHAAAHPSTSHSAPLMPSAACAATGSSRPSAALSPPPSTPVSGGSSPPDHRGRRPDAPGGLRGLAIRVARAVNRALGRRGAVWGDRYHARPLTTPREVRNALVYVLQNVAKHARGLHGLDPCSSARWFDGWHDAAAAGTIERAPVAKARTWLATVGWRRHGLINPYTECPRTHTRRLHVPPGSVPLASPVR